MLEEKETCEELEGLRQTKTESVEYGFEEPPEPGCGDSCSCGEMPVRKRMGVMTKIIIVLVMVTVLLSVSAYMMYYA